MTWGGSTGGGLSLIGIWTNGDRSTRSGNGVLGTTGGSGSVAGS